MSAPSYQVISSVAVAILNPAQRVIESDLLITSGVLPFHNTSEAFEFLTQTIGLCQCDLALFDDRENQKIAFAISINGFSEIAKVSPKARQIMNRAKGLVHFYV
jgi:hypothetical protein